MAYIKQDIINYTMQDTAKELMEKKAINKDQYNNIVTSFSHDLYCPTLFLRFVAGIITTVGCLFASGFVGLLFAFTNFRFMAFVCGVLSIITLELMIKHNKIFNAGTDNVLQLIAVGCFSTFFILDILSANNAFTYALLMLFCAACSYRYVDAFMALLANLSAVMFVVLACFASGSNGKLIAPFVIFLFAAAEYYTLKNILAKETIFIYKKTLKSLSTFSLILMYASLNYYVVCELNNSINNTNNTSIPMGWIFWITTFTIPVIYIVRSIIMKNKSLLLTGIFCLVTSIASFRYYHSIMPPEWALFITGILLIAVGYSLIQLLEQTRNGFTSQNIFQQTNKNTLLESMIAAQATASANQSINKANSGVHFGGGSSGGGGATDSF